MKTFEKSGGRLFRIAGIFTIILIFIGVSYEAISGFFIVRARDRTISRMESDYQSLIDGLHSVTDILADSQGQFDKYFTGSGELTDSINTSKELATKLRNDNNRLRDENQKLRDAISSSITGTTEIGHLSAVAGEAVDDCITILERYNAGN